MPLALKQFDSQKIVNDLEPGFGPNQHWVVTFKKGSESKEIGFIAPTVESVGRMAYKMSQTQEDLKLPPLYDVYGWFVYSIVHDYTQ